MTEIPVYGSGRIGMHKPAYGQTLYEVTDHLGNVRAVIGGSVQTTMLATMENERKEKESVDFFGMHTTVTATDINHTMAEVTVDGETDVVDPNEVIRLNNRPNGRYSPNPIGGGTMLWVHPGDTVRAEVFAKYARIGQTRNKNQLVTLAAMLQSLSPIDNAAEMRKAFQMLSRSEFRALPVWGKLDDAQPPAFLNGLLFDKDMKLQTFDFDQVSDQARIKAVHDTVGHERLAVEFVVEKEGYLYIYISNESKENLDVYFDDLKVTQVYGTVVAGGDYYPYGLPIEDRQITLEDYRFGYQGQFAEEDEETGWNHFELREYDAVIGRTVTTDPARQFHSPYIWVGNNPVIGTDPSGGVSPIYDLDGNFLGTDDEGLQGDAIFMHASHFSQGMSHERALEAGFTFSQFRFFDINLEASAAAFNHQNELPNRPDWDGFVTIDEGIAWAKLHPGALSAPSADNALYINSALLDFGDVSTSLFDQLSISTPVNLFSLANTYNSTTNATLRATVYALGRVNMVLVHRENRQVRIVNDEATDYDWNGGGGLVRGNFIRAERARTGLNDSHGFKAYYYGIGTLNN